ncbi:BamA/TamA family outer membrane protein [Panacagrimonas sp.]|uniref:BamA/TamA family outer membrane protein n=1 Tax=Panacagrimonas sp. TaxID=2480088 RepID=UPI003B51C0CF
MRAALYLLVYGAAAQVRAETGPTAVEAESVAGSAAPRVVGIEFSGNRVTRPRVMLRELTFDVGDIADPKQIEASRQAIQNLGLFRAVEVEPVAVSGGEIVIFTVEEKLYLLPFPRLDAKDSGEYAYGMQMRWTNLFGRNHDLRAFWEYRDRKEAGIGGETAYAIDYGAPQLFDSRYSLDVGAGYSTRPVERDGEVVGDYQETFRSARVQLSRSLSPGSANQGWWIGGGLGWLEQSTEGADAEPAYGTATSMLLGVGYRDLQFRRYSEVGQTFGLGASVAIEDWNSDYHQLSYRLDWRRYIAVGQRAHQNLNLGAEAGLRHGGPPDNDAYELGGSSSLRGYDNDFLEGDAYYRVSAEFLRPLRWNSLRALAIVEAGNVFEQPGDASLDRLYTSLGLGLRLRVDWFVDVELDLGYALPLTGDGGGRVFVGRP